MELLFYSSVFNLILMLVAALLLIRIPQP